VQAIEAIQRYAAVGTEAFHADELIQDGIIRRLEIIGEAVKNLSAELTAREPSVPWKEAARTRDLLIHGYFRVNLGIVWSVVENELPTLKQHVLRILSTPTLDWLNRKQAMRVADAVPYRLRCERHKGHAFQASAIHPEPRPIAQRLVALGEVEIALNRDIVLERRRALRFERWRVEMPFCRA
jgi:uncharacterized protein with HEPN domain